MNHTDQELAVTILKICLYDYNMDLGDVILDQDITVGFNRRRLSQGDKPRGVEYAAQQGWIQPMPSPVQPPTIGKLTESGFSTAQE